MANTDLIGSAEACALLRIDRSTLTRWVQLGKITPSLRMPGKSGVMLFRRSDVTVRATEYAAERAPVEATR